MKGFCLRRAFAAAFFSAALLMSGCGDTYRPVANPLPNPNGPDPQNSGVAVVLSNTGAASEGVTTTIDLSGDTNLGQLSLGLNSTYAFSPDNFRVIAANAGDDTLTQYFPVTSPLGSTRSATTLTPGSAPVFIAVANGSAGEVAYTANPTRNTLGVIAAGTGVESTEVQLAPTAHPTALVVTPNGLKVYSLNSGDNTVTAVSTKDNTITATLSVGAGPVSAVASPDSSFVYVMSKVAGTVAQISTVTDAITATIPVGSAPVAAAYSTRLLRLFIANQGSNSVSIIDVDPRSSTKYTVLATVPVGVAPSSVAVLGDGTRAYVANSGSNSVSVIELVGNKVLRTVAVGTNPMSIAASSDSRKVIVVNQNDNTISLIDTTDDHISNTIPVPPTPILVTATL